MARLAQHDQRVVAGGVHILSGDVVAAQVVDSFREGFKHGFGLLGGVSDDDTLAAAVGQAGYGVLVGHTPGQPEHIKQGIVVGLIGPQTAAADSGTQVGVVDSDDGLQTGLLVVDKQDLLVTVLAHFGHCVHKKTS